MWQSVNYLWKTAVMLVLFLPTFVADTKSQKETNSRGREGHALCVNMMQCVPKLICDLPPNKLATFCCNQRLKIFLLKIFKYWMDAKPWLLIRFHWYSVKTLQSINFLMLTEKSSVILVCYQQVLKG